jgi:CheY-like chemotaxis protein
MRDTTQQPSGGWPPSDGTDDLLREARQRFIAGFPKHCESIDLLLKTIAARGPKGSAEPLREAARQIAATAGTIGFPNVSERASELEMLAALADKGFNLEVARGQLEALRETFAREISSPPAWVDAPTAYQPESGIPILVVDESEDQRQLIADYLQLAGYEPVALSSGETVLEAARVHRPGAILLEANLPGLDGYSVCRLLKSDPDLARIPVVFVTVRSTLEDKLAGLTLGADDYLVKPIDPRELLLRIDMVLRRPRTSR